MSPFLEVMNTFISKVRNNWGKLAVTGSVALANATLSRAVDAFDYATFNTVLTGGVVVVGATAGVIAAVKGGVMVWNKIAKYFNRAG